MDKKKPIEDIGLIPENIHQGQIHLDEEGYNEEDRTVSQAILFWNNDIYNCINCYIDNPLYVLQKGMKTTSILLLKLIP